MRKFFIILICIFLTACSKSDTVIPTSTSGDTATGWGFRPVAGARPEFTTGQIQTMEKYNCIYMGSENQPYVYLTFDEGYENGYTADILDTLKKCNVTAAFFITSDYLNKNPDLVKRMIDEGHTVGNHSVNHPSMPSKNDADVQNEIMGLHKEVFEKFGVNMKFFRPPMGEYSERTLSIANNLGYTNVFWSFAYKDWETDNQKGADYAFEQVTSKVHNGAVILLHAVSKDNAAALYKIITEIQNKGFIFKSLSEYIALTTNTKGGFEM